MPSISGQSILIMGGSSGMGFAIAKTCVADGLRVAIASSSKAKVDDALKRLDAACPDAKFKTSGYTIDLSSDDVETDMESLFASVTQQSTHLLDHIINTAGRPNMSSISDVDLSSLRAIAQVPLFVPLLLGKLAPKYLKPGYTSSLIFTSGQVVDKPVPGYSILATYAAGVHGLTRNLASDLAPRRVNCVSPGSTETELWGDYADMMRKMAIEKSLLGKPATAEEVAEAYVYLMRNTDATGSIVSTNAGAPLK